MQFDYKETKIKLRDKEYTVCIPHYMFSNLHINPESGKHLSAIFFSSKDDMLNLALAFHHYKKSENTILYIKGQKTMPFCFSCNMSGRDDCVDLVFLTHKMQFKHKDWKLIRPKLKKEKLLHKSYIVNEKSFQTKDFKDYSLDENKDYLDLHLNYSILFLCGSEPIFADLTEDCYKLSICDLPLENGIHRHAIAMFRDAKKIGSAHRDLIFHLFDPKWSDNIE